jgi:hypothetical protein
MMLLLHSLLCLRRRKTSQQPAFEHQSDTQVGHALVHFSVPLANTHLLTLQEV